MTSSCQVADPARGSGRRTVAAAALPVGPIDRVRRCRRGSGGRSLGHDAVAVLDRIGSGKRPVVKANEWLNPLSALVAYLAKNPGRRVAVVARRHRAVARLEPTVELLLHHVAVGAGPGIVPQVRRALRVDEGVTPESHRRSKGDGNHDREQDCHLGLWS